MAHWDSEFQRVRSPILRYGFAVVSVVVATAVALAIQEYQFRDVELPLLVLVVGLVTWYAGNGPAVVAVLLSTAGFNYFFAEPIYSFYVSARDLPYFLIFVLSAVIIASFSAVRRRVEDNLRHARDRLQDELEQRQLREAEIRKLNQELTLRASELVTANKELESFAYSVSHDIRGPLRHLGGYSELLQKHASSVLDATSRRYVKTILD
jgi:K+-sensing histidine kinase KdpD